MPTPLPLVILRCFLRSHPAMLDPAMLRVLPQTHHLLESYMAGAHQSLMAV